LFSRSFLSVFSLFLSPRGAFPLRSILSFSFGSFYRSLPYLSVSHWAFLSALIFLRPSCRFLTPPKKKKKRKKGKERKVPPFLGGTPGAVLSALLVFSGCVVSTPFCSVCCRVAFFVAVPRCS